MRTYSELSAMETLPRWRLFENPFKSELLPITVMTYKATRRSTKLPKGVHHFVW